MASTFIAQNQISPLESTILHEDFSVCSVQAVTPLSFGWLVGFDLDWNKIQQIRLEDQTF